MANITKSARGASVDFDLLKIKQQIASAPKPTQVQAREDFVDQKFKRRLKRLNSAVTQNTSSNLVQTNETTKNDESSDDVANNESKETPTQPNAESN